MKKEKEEVKSLLQEKQAAVRLSNQNIPQYICYWADGSVKSGDSVSPVLEAAKRPVVEELSQRLLAYLTPHGQFVLTEGGWVGQSWYGCPICGNQGMLFSGTAKEGSFSCSINACCTESPVQAGCKWVQLT